MTESYFPASNDEPLDCRIEIATPRKRGNAMNAGYSCHDRFSWSGTEFFCPFCCFLLFSSLFAVRNVKMAVYAFRLKMRLHRREIPMPIICQKYLFPLSVGLLLLLPLTSGCGWFTGWFTSKPKHAVITDEQSETLSLSDAEPSHRKLGDPAPARPEPLTPLIVEPVPPIEVNPPEPIPERVVEEVPPPVEPPQPVVVIPESPEQKTQADAESEGSVPVRITEPVDQISPVDETSPVDTESPVNTTAPVQSGGLSWFLVRRIPVALLMLLETEPSSSALPPPADSEAILSEPQPDPPVQSEAAPTAENQDSTELQPVQPLGDQMSSGQPQSSGRSGENTSSRRSSRSDRSENRDSAEPSAVVRQPRREPATGIRFNFRYAAWKDVIEWFADQAALSLQADKMPVGTLNLSDGQNYSPTEGLDILNSYLLFKDYSLLRKGQSLFLIYLPDGIPANLLEPITPDELDSRGRYELCKCVFNLNRTTPDLIQAEVEKLLGPQGSIAILPKSQQILITETGGTLRTIREIIRRIDDPDSVTAGTIHMIETKNLTAEEALQIMRTLLAIDTADPSLRTAVDSSGRKILLSGRGDMIERAKEVINRIDTSFGSDDPTMVGQPQFETYDVGFADPATVFAVLQTLLVGTPDARLSLDPKTGGIMLRARPAAHATVREAIRQMQLNVPQVDIIPLKRMSPNSAVETIKKFIATSSLAPTTSLPPQNRDDRDRRTTTNSSTSPPTVEADVMARQLIVRGTISQIADIRALLAKLGEDGVASTSSNLATIRAIPLSPAATSLVLEQLQSILPKLDPNIKVVVPEMMEEKKEKKDPNIDSLIDETFDTEPPMTQWQRIAAQPILAQVLESKKQSEVVVTVTPAGIVLSSNDPEALSKLEEVIRMLSDETVLGKMELKVYNLTHSTAAVVSSTLQTLLGTNTSTVGVTGAGSVDLPEWQYSEVMGLLSAQGSTIEKTGNVTITPDERLNALYIQANLVDHKTIAKLLEILDQPKRNDILNQAIARFIRLENIKAAEAKTTVETVFANRMQGNNSSGSRGLLNSSGNVGGIDRGSSDRGGTPPGSPVATTGGPPGGPGGGLPPEMIQQLMARMGNRGSSTPREQEPPMTLAVEPMTNSLIVSSSEALYLEVKAFVEALDAAALEITTVTVTTPLVNISTDLAQQTLRNMLGTSVDFSTTQAPQMSSGMFGSSGFGSSGFRPGGSGTFGSGMSPFSGGSSPFGSSGFRPLGSSTFGGGTAPLSGGGSTFGSGNPFMNMMRSSSSSFGGSPSSSSGSSFRSGTFGSGSGSSFQPGGSSSSSSRGR